MITHQPQFIVHDVEYYETKSEIKFTFSIANPNLCNKDLYIRLDDSLFGFRLYGETLNLVQNKFYWISTSNLPFSKWAFFSVEDGGQTIFKEEFRFSKQIKTQRQQEVWKYLHVGHLCWQKELRVTKCCSKKEKKPSIFQPMRSCSTRFSFI